MRLPVGYQMSAASAGFLLFFGAGTALGQWNERLAATAFAADNLARLDTGEVLGKRATLDQMANVMAVETCFLLPIPPERASQVLMNWDPTQYKELGVVQHVAVSRPPQPADFQSLRLDPAFGPNQVLLQRTEALARGSLSQNVSQGELKIFEKNPNQPEASWRRLLQERAEQYQKSGLKQMPPYDNVRPAFSIQANWQRVVSMTPEITRRFIDVLQIALNNPSLEAPGLVQKNYWEALSAQGETVLLLGGLAQLPTPESVRTADLQYYVSSQFGSTLILHEMWPVTWKGKPATLVWRADYVLLPASLTAKGIERMASENLLLQEVRRSVAAFSRAAVK